MSTNVATATVGNYAAIYISSSGYHYKMAADFAKSSVGKKDNYYTTNGVLLFAVIGGVTLLKPIPMPCYLIPYSQ
jgi:hypothetical protein